LSRKDRIEQALLAFFATRTDGTSAAVFRVGMGLLAVWQAFGIWLNLDRFYGDTGVVPFEVVKGDNLVWLSLFSIAPASRAVLLFHAIAFTVGSVALLFGLYPRIASLLVAYLHVSMQMRNPFILNSGDRLFMIVLALGAAMPLANRASIHAFVRKLRGKPELPLSTVWGQRLVGLQISYVYLNTVIAKLSNERWREGLALRDVLASPVFAEWPRYIESKPLIMGMTYSTLVFELTFPIAIWFKKTRPWWLLWGIGFHLMIDALMVIPIFSWIMIVSYASFLSDSEVKWLLSKLRLRKAAASTDEATERSERPVPSPSS